mgnify:CR=1 FL=1|jgi:hypothetical protein|tara:strand:- start:1165 stop:1428 length:264 start_codon:yes stop_codon:yes gene_type:complete
MSRIYAPVSSSVGQKITGSIGKIIALGNDDAEQTLTRVEFGILTEPESQFTASSVIGSIVVPAGGVIDGPIARVQCGGAFLVYVEQK